jgi:8-hydroxy-5-deazaflavin:NADPH oxidoreductase
VVTVPVKAFPDLPAAPPARKTVIDTCNYGPERDGNIPELDDKSLTSSELLLAVHPGRHARESVQQHLLQAPAVTCPPGRGGRPLIPADRRGLRTAKAAVTEFIESIGYSVVDAGPLADSWRQATGTPGGTPYGPPSNEKGQLAGEDAIRAALATATR